MRNKTKGLAGAYLWALALMAARPVVAASPTGTITPTFSVSPTSTITATCTVTPTNTITATCTVTPTRTITATRTVTSTRTTTVGATISPTQTLVASIVATDAPTPPAPSREGEARAFPNPARGATAHFAFEMREAGVARLTVWTVAGVLASVVEERFGVGNKQLLLNVKDYAAGIYLFQLSLEYESGRKVEGPVQRIAIAR